MITLSLTGLCMAAVVAAVMLAIMHLHLDDKVDQWLQEYPHHTRQPGRQTRQEA